MSIDKSLMAGSTTILVLKLLEERDMYGYQMIETLAQRSDDTFNLKAGTLYPILHNLRNNGYVESYEKEESNGKIRKYYYLTSKGKKLLREKQKEWITFSSAVNKILNGGLSYEPI
ncbi:PadR family transcriptional regulator [Acetivibrio thermocellus]|uniref:Transcriptional regulator, PadR-like family n=1 Tax=Acetivibrio thermocellus (strain ATCC 27405 / DSM 1237 / JCM 9322 / NBRC 103400 / NCIMB 10682 / NRRL B-4536 / VPI 7372) TaxID=203119 RepID=A3DGN6_ACET2|nr:helix-turn-helix transcriptional regulator [Acetivibrio thermocellus]ABN53115.1 transcriptional regulator, PadR-like family [Acetivibrio thermocellus ATCC 27405]